MDDSDYTTDWNLGNNYQTTAACQSTSPDQCNLYDNQPHYPGSISIQDVGFSLTSRNTTTIYTESQHRMRHKTLQQELPNVDECINIENTKCPSSDTNMNTTLDGNGNPSVPQTMNPTAEKIMLGNSKYRKRFNYATSKHWACAYCVLMLLGLGIIAMYWDE
jgi:hypothetical protein